MGERMTASDPKLRVALADDDPQFRGDLAAVLNARDDVSVVLSVGNGYDLLARLSVQQVDVVLLDVEMPAISGLDVARQIRSQHPNLPVVMLTVFRRQESLGQALAAGARGFLTKDAPIDFLVEQMRRAVKGDTVLSPQPTAILASSYSALAAAREQDRQFLRACDSLPTRLAEVLNELIQGSTNKTIAQNLRLTDTVVRNYVSLVLRHTGCESRTELAIRALRCGYEGRTIAEG